MNYLVGVDLKFLDTATMAWGEEIFKKRDADGYFEGAVART